MPCPTILTFDGEIFQKPYGGEHFIVMAYCLGSVYPNGSFNENQMFDLWPKTGMMHHLLNKSPHVARAIVTWKFNIRLVQAFLESYRKEHLIPIEVLARSLKFLLEYGK